ncbi:MAG TPA: nuclear transport factor 2 family protein [Candidatus Dormibacteraeota bacterium]|nr:nuclear transport factor 2 family protein [Candidatus Dormibacteraeota bacterium]
MTHVASRNTFLLQAHSLKIILLGTLLFFIAVSPAAAQKKKKNAPTPPADNSSVVPLPDEQQVDYVISEMLGAWQLNDTERMHKDYADDVVVVQGVYAPPVIGWTNYLTSYQASRQRMNRVRLDRANTFIRVDGNVAWACYQWDFAAVVDEQTSTAQGQTTLVLQKRDGKWLIVLNHTSLVSPTPSGAPANTPKPPAAVGAKPS